MRFKAKSDSVNRRNGQPSRRSLLRIGSLGALGLTLPRLLRAESEQTGSEKPGKRHPTPKSTIRSCILIFYYGGPSHLDSWDMKPSAPRGPGTVRFDCYEYARAAGQRTHAPYCSGHGSSCDRSEHAPPDDQS